MTPVPQADAAALVDEFVARYRPAIADGMRRALDLPGIAHVELMRYHLGWVDASGQPADAQAGKMLRPALCLLAAEACGADPERALPAAVAVELLHNFTLIHDDIEDGSATRHGRPTLWTVAGVPLAINAGDGLFVIARRTLLDLARTGCLADRVLAAVELLDDACVRLCEGQHADIQFESREAVTAAEYEAMIAGKTGALLGASAALGAIAAGADEATVKAFSRYGQALGLAFQLQDDVIGIWGDAAATGKPVGDDIRARKKSFPVIYAADHLPADDAQRLRNLYATGEPLDDAGVTDVTALLGVAGAREASVARARQHAREAIDAVTGLPLERAHMDSLQALATFVVHRDG